MPDTPQPAGRRDGIVRAAVGVFLRFGPRKTSMDDVARAADISRQGLYLHFKTKNALFRAVVAQMLDDLRGATWQALGRADHTVEERLAGAFEAFHAVTVEIVDRETYAETLRAAQAFAAAPMNRLEHDLVTDVAALLTQSGRANAWEAAGLSATDVAQHLFDASTGAKYESASLDEYRRRLRVSVRVVTRP
ncbi:TetR/AcrR family transcriptional regulator [Streptomyces malaysiensis subsp. malaysiensis]|uniref:TetR/AcrR family transcriptional regulator n=1 Tax=Streptomyces malaysiensis TaxID=92644 RepID=UPI0024BFBD33|nr:TetR/AcrR family transcriptional regulator [Streptomyces sp. NA07423]WHX22333.1 TetR/AcrR family transcriptional regulator [Streptomyces sp. NA07423]